MFVEQPLALPRSAKYQVNGFPNSVEFCLLRFSKFDSKLYFFLTKEAKLRGCLRETSDNVIKTCQAKKIVRIISIIFKISGGTFQFEEKIPHMGDSESFDVCG